MIKKVLVVDDELDIVNFMERFLIRMGISVVTATDGDKAVERCRIEKPDCVFLDLQMPGKNGLVSLAEMKTFDPDLPVVMITGKDSEEYRKQAMDIGASDYITKPIDLAELNDKIQTYVLAS
jgi:DNA-binding response OmpR family regulator